MLRKSISFVHCAMLSVALAQSVRFSGTVTDLSGAPIANAKVSLSAGGLTTSSDAQGRFTIENTTTGIGEPGLRGISGSLRDGFPNPRFENQSRVTLAVFSTLGEKLSSQSLTVRSGEHAFPLYGKNGYFIYRLSASEHEYAFKHPASAAPIGLAKPTVSSAAFYDILKVTAGGYRGYEGVLASSGSGIDTSGLKIVLLKDGDLPHFSFFVTSLVAMRALSGSQNGFGGDLRYGHTGPGAGLRGADKICADVAERSMKGASAKQWRAFLSVSDAGNGTKQDAIDRIGPGPWYDRRGRVLANDLSGLRSGDRPAGGDPAVAEDLPNENGEPNHTAGGVVANNHDVLTGSDRTGRLHTNGGSCDNWTSTTKVGNVADAWKGPAAGHSWPAHSGRNWMLAHRVMGCAASVVVGEGVDISNPVGNGVGDAGGYGAIYCFALVP